MIKDKELIRKITTVERLPVILLATISMLSIIFSLFAWIWYPPILSLKMSGMGVLGLILAQKIEYIIILYVDKQLAKEMSKPGIGKWENRMIDYCDDINYESQKKENEETINRIMDGICKN